ncbi:hypothetical protein PENTCL1PPCAC_5438, partial [Pristionchus entomophagus]
VEESSAGAEIHVPKPGPIALSDVRWTSANIGEEEKEKKRSLTDGHPTVACVLHARRSRLQQVLATSQTWLPTCDFHALISFGEIAEQLKSFPQARFTHPSGGLEKCFDRIALNLSTTLFPHADWHFLASDDSFVMVDRLREWLRQQKASGASYLDISSDGRPALLISDEAIGSLNITECDQTAIVAVGSLLKRSDLSSLPSVDSMNRPIILRGETRSKMAVNLSLSPHLSIVQRVSPSEMTLMHHIHTPQT